jgi:DNA-binding IclR family transcriptional regulator
MPRSRPVMQTLQHGLQLLNLIAASQAPVSISELRQATGLHSSTISRLLTALIEQGYIKRVKGRRFAFDYGSLIIGGAALLQDPLIKYGRRPLDELSIGASVPTYLGIAWREQTLVLYRSWSHVQEDGHAFCQPGLPVHISSIGKAIAAYWDEARSRAYAEKLAEQGPAWLAELERIRELGYAARVMKDAFQSSPTEPHRMSVAAPVRDATGCVVAAVAIETGNIDEKLAMLLATAERLSELLGYRVTEQDYRITGGGV